MGTSGEAQIYEAGSNPERERAEKDAAEAAAGQVRADGGLERPVEPPAMPGINATNVDDIRNTVDAAPADSDNIASLPPAAPPMQPPSAPPLSDSGATVHTAPPAALKRVRFDLDAATGANAHPPDAVPGAYPPTSQLAPPPASPPKPLQKPTIPSSH